MLSDTPLAANLAVLQMQAELLKNTFAVPRTPRTKGRAGGGQIGDKGGVWRWECV